MLQEKHAEHMIGTVHSGVREDGSGYLAFVCRPKTKVWWTPAGRTLAIHRNVAIELIGILHTLLASLDWLANPQPSTRTKRFTANVDAPALVVTSLGPIQDGILECRLDEVDGLNIVLGEDGLSSFELSSLVAEQLARGLSLELGRIASWAGRDE